MLFPVTSAHSVVRRTAAATRLPWPVHDWCAVGLPMHLVPGSLTVLDGDTAAIDALLSRVAGVNDKRTVLSPAPMAVVRATRDPAAQSIDVIQAALAAGTPVVVSGGRPAAVVAAGEPMPDLRASIVTTPREFVIEPTAVGSVRAGYTVTLTGQHAADHLLHLFQAWIQSSLAGLPNGRGRR
jgi:hypothetical protein